jgi:hypothetical protein
MWGEAQNTRGIAGLKDLGSTRLLSDLINIHRKGIFVWLSTK